MALAFSAIAFNVSAPSVWNSLSCNCISAELLGTLKRILKLNCLTLHLPVVNVNTQPSPCHCAPLICSRHMALWRFGFLIEWLKWYHAKLGCANTVETGWIGFRLHALVCFDFLIVTYESQTSTSYKVDSGRRLHFLTWLKLSRLDLSQVNWTSVWVYMYLDQV